ncbi:hypothetical protein Hanom_Chr16g01491591 [Helianthus anomalus]
MVSYREVLKSSVVISLLQARLKMAYEAKTKGFECPSWNHPAKAVVEEPSKGAEKVTDAGGDAEKDVGADLGPGAGAGEAMVE